MKKTFKIIATLVGVSVALVLAIVIIVPLLFNPNDYRDEIAQLVKEKTGRELILHDDLELSLFPWIGITTGAIELGNASGFGDQPFARIERAEVKVKLLPLLSQQVEASTVILRGLRLHLTVNKEGVSNWDDLAGGSDETTPATQTSPTTAPAAATPATAGLAAVAIGGVQIEDAEISYSDLSAQQQYQIRKLNLITGPLLPGTPLKVSLQTVFDATDPELRGQFNLDSQILFDLAQERYRFDNTRLNTSLNSSDLPGGKAEIELAASIAVDMKQQTASLKGLNLKSYGVNLSGDLNLQQLIDNPAFNGRLKLAELNPRSVMQQLEIEAPETTDGAALSRLSASFNLDGDTSNYNITQLAMALDQSKIDGELKATLSDAPMPAVRYALTIDQLDADRYLPPASEESDITTAAITAPPTAATGVAAVATATEDAVPMETLRELDLHGTLQLGKLKVTDLNLSEINTEITAKDGVIRLHPLTAKLYQGSYRGDIKLDARGDKLKLAVNESLQQVQVGPLLQDYMGEDRVRGNGTIEAQLTATGDTVEKMTKTLNGTARIAFIDGAIKDVNIVQMVNEAKAKLKGRTPPPKTAGMRDTDFAEMRASFKIKNGVANNRDLSIKSPYLRVGGEGSVNLVNETIDYLAKAVIIKSEEGQGGADISDLHGLELPVRITGTFAQPSFKLELGDALKQKAKQALEEKKAKLKTELEKRKAEERAALESKKAKAKAAEQQRIEAEKERLKRELEEKAKEKLKSLFDR